MSELIHHRCCPICRGLAAPYIEGAQDLHYNIDGVWTYQQCVDCDAVFLNPAPDPKFLAQSYDDDYYSYQEPVEPRRWKMLLRRFIGYEIGATGDPTFVKPGRMLDIGCGSGSFLLKMKRAGWEVHGVELSAKAAQVGNRHGLNIQAGTARTASLPDGYFDYIRLNHSFEHITDPHETLDRIRGWLSPSGLLFIGVPNTDGLAARWFGKYWWNLGPPVHPFNYSRATLSRLLAEHGFKTVSFRTNSNFAGILGSTQMMLNAWRGRRKDTGWLLYNPAAKILCHWLAKLSDLYNIGDCLEIVAAAVDHE